MKLILSTLIILMTLPTYAIIGGKDLTNNDPEGKSVVALYNFYGSLCTATIIAPQYALTAAHCFISSDPSDYSLRFGTDIFSDYESTTTREVIELIPHELYSEVNGGYDIALVKFKGSLPKGVQVASLPTQSFSYYDSTIVVVGYGMPSVLPEPIPFEGTGILRSVSMIASKRTSFVVADKSQGKGTSHGDSGAPAFQKKSKNKYTVVGVTNGSNNCLDDGEINPNCIPYSLFADVFDHLGWINRQINQRK